MKNLKKWQYGLMLFIPFLGIINPLLYVIIFVGYFIAFMIYLIIDE